LRAANLDLGGGCLAATFTSRGRSYARSVRAVRAAILRRLRRHDDRQQFVRLLRRACRRVRRLRSAGMRRVCRMRRLRTPGFLHSSRTWILLRRLGKRVRTLRACDLLAMRQMPPCGEFLRARWMLRTAAAARARPFPPGAYASSLRSGTGWHGFSGRVATGFFLLASAASLSSYPRALTLSITQPREARPTVRPRFVAFKPVVATRRSCLHGVPQPGSDHPPRMVLAIRPA
jgi:hypothetical protein